MEGTIAAIAIKPGHGAPMSLVDEAEVTQNGLQGNVEQQSHRQVTFMSKEQWAQTEQDLGAELPWHTRRSNILVEGFAMGGLKGKTIQAGDVQVLITGETKPCGLMDELHQGLRQALTPECRGGVYGSVQQTGQIRVGDTVRVLG